MPGKYMLMDEGSIGEYEIYEYRFEVPGLRPVSFNVDWVPGSERAWLLEVLNKNFERAAQEAHAQGQQDVRWAIKEALQL